MLWLTDRSRNTNRFFVSMHMCFTCFNSILKIHVYSSQIIVTLLASQQQDDSLFGNSCPKQLLWTVHNKKNHLPVTGQTSQIVHPPFPFNVFTSIYSRNLTFFYDDKSPQIIRGRSEETGTNHTRTTFLQP